MNVRTTTLLTTPLTRRGFVGAAGAAGAFAALTACSSDSSGDSGGGPASDQSLRFGISGEPQPVKVGADQGATGYMLDALIHRGLLKYDNDGNVVAALAESWETPDPSTCAVVLRSGLTFSDGSPLTAANVKNTLEFLAVPDNGARTLQGMKNIAAVDVTDDTHLTVRLAQPDPDFPQYLADSTAFIAPDAALVAGQTATVGAGPFVLDSEQDGVSMTLTKSPSFYGAADVVLETIELVYYADTTARTNALLSGDVDLIDYVAWEDFDRIGGTDGIVLDAQAGLLMDVEFNVVSGPFADPLVRQAAAHAVNRDNVVKAAFFGHAAAQYGIPLGEDSPFRTPRSQALWSYDPGKARELLAQAGVADGFSCRLLTSSQYSFHQDTALSVQADLAAVGIDATLESPDWATRMQLSTDGDYDVKVNGWGGIVTSPAYLEAVLGGPDVAKSFGYDNPEVMDALARGRTSATQEDRVAAYGEAFELIATDVPLASLAQRDQAFAYSDRVTGFKNLPGFLTFYSGYAFENASMSA